MADEPGFAGLSLSSRSSFGTGCQTSDTCACTAVEAVSREQQRKSKYVKKARLNEGRPALLIMPDSSAGTTDCIAAVPPPESHPQNKSVAITHESRCTFFTPLSFITVNAPDGRE